MLKRFFFNVIIVEARRKLGYGLTVQQQLAVVNANFMTSCFWYLG